MINIHYFKSQSWPFPDSLMIGFTAEYESGKILIDTKEIVEADWFKADNLPVTPGKQTPAGELIERFILNKS
jgi:NAD+ diphosphatase